MKTTSDGRNFFGFVAEVFACNPFGKLPEEPFVRSNPNEWPDEWPDDLFADSARVQRAVSRAIEAVRPKLTSMMMPTVANGPLPGEVIPADLRGRFYERSSRVF